MTSTLALGLLIVRVIVGLTVAAHGAQKLFGWFGGPGFARFSKGMQAQGLKPGSLWAAFAVLGELGGGLSLAFGLLTPLGAAGVFGAMLMAGSTHLANGFWNSKRGFEFPLTLLTVALALGLTGPGAYSLDALLELRWPAVVVFVALAIAALIVVAIGLLLKRAAPSAAQAQPAQPTQPSQPSQPSQPEPMKKPA